MGGYADEYEDLDEYEDEYADEEEYEEGEEEEEEEDPQQTQDVQDYLVLRQRLKEAKRENLKKELGIGNANSRDKKNPISRAKDNFGSFFGSSKPVIAQRVIQESKSLLENPNMLAKAMKSKHMVNKSSVSVSNNTKSQARGPSPKVSNGTHKKIQMLKDARDYSFLESDDAQLPVPAKEPQRNVSAPKSDARSAQWSERNKDSLGSSGRKVPYNRDDIKKPTALNGQVRPKAGDHRLAVLDKHKRALAASQKPPAVRDGKLARDGKQISSHVGSGPGRPVVSKSMPPKVSGSAIEKRIAMAAGKPSLPAGKPSVPAGKPSVPAGKPSMPAGKSSSLVQKPSHLKMQPHVSKQHIRKWEHEELRKQKVLPKQAAPPPKPKVNHPPVKSSVRAAPVDDRSRKRPTRHFDEFDDPNVAISMIRNLFRYNPSRYKDVDDDSDMEANFEDIMREEKRSARIAKKEDEEELRKIEEEERRERMRKEAKKRKLR